MNLRSIPINKPTPAPYNPRKTLKPGSPRYKKLERSLTEFSLVQPIVWNEKTGHIVAGHQRFEILKNQGAESIDVVVVSLSLEREKALNITLNNSEVGSDWDAEKLVDLVAQLHDLPDFDATLTGFDDADINDLLLTPQTDHSAPQQESTTEQTLVLVHLEIPAESWESTRPHLDKLIQSQNLTAHITTPT